MNRADLMKVLAAAEALADTCKKALKDEPARLYLEEGTAVSERVPGVGSLSVSLSQDGAVVTDDKMFLDWLAARYPTEVESVTRVRNPDWMRKLLTQLAPVDPEEIIEGEATSCMDAEGTVIPGVAWFRGGKFLYASVKIESVLKRRYAEDAAAFLERGEPMAALGLSPRPAIEGTVSDLP